MPPTANNSSSDDDNQALFQEILLEHGNYPRHLGVPANAQCILEARDPLKADHVRLGITLDEHGKLCAIGFEASGSVVLKASCSLMSESLLGKQHPDAIAAIDKFLAMLADPAQPATVEDWREVAALSAIRRFPARVQCASMPWRLAQQVLNSIQPA